MKRNKIKVLVAGQTPPPAHGQAVMIKKMLEGNYKDAELFHVRLDFSRDIDEIGRFSFRKSLKLISVIGRIIYQRFKNDIDVLYYPPSGANLLPMYRDFIVLISTRWLFKKTIFHFHAGGISELYNKLGKVPRFFYRLAYFNTDAAIRISELNPEDGRILKTKKEFIIPHGIEDNYNKFKRKNRKKNPDPKILFVGALRESKGILVLLDACNMLKKKGIKFQAELMGKFASELFEKKVKKRVSELSLQQDINFLGVLTGYKKLRSYSNADIFCFPTFYECETFGIVLLEAMQFGLPVVATKWRGIPSIIENNKSGYLVPIKDSKAVAKKLENLIKNPKLAHQMGKRGREIFLKRYTIDKFHRNMEKVFNFTN